MNNPSEPTDLRITVLRLSSEAFILAQEYAGNTSDLTLLQKRAEVINTRLDELWPMIQKLPAFEQADLGQAWSDARLDADYVLSNGELSTSTRLYYYLQSFNPKK